VGPAEDRPDEQQAETSAEGATTPPRKGPAKKGAAKAAKKVAPAKKPGPEEAATEPGSPQKAAAEPAKKAAPTKRARPQKATAQPADAPAKKATAKKAAAKKSADPEARARKSAASPGSPDGPTAKKGAAKKSAAKRTTAKKAPGKDAPDGATPREATARQRPGTAMTEPPAEQRPSPGRLAAEPARDASPGPSQTPRAEAAPVEAKPARTRRRGGRFRRPEIVSQPTTSPIPKVPTRDPRRLQQRVAVIIPAKNEARRIAATVRSAKSIPQVDLVLVVDDGSEDDTQHRAREAGAVVVRHSHNRGKAAAMETGAAVVAMRDTPERPPRLLLFIDADLGETAVNTAPLIPPVAEHAADFSIALLPPQAGAGGRGLVVNAARRGIARLTGWAPTQPLSGMRCLTRAAFEAATPLARGWGVETGMTIDLLRQGFVAVEVPCDLRHRPSGNDLGGTLHRAAQYRDVKLALAARQLRSAAEVVTRGPASGR